ncbi:cell division protein FtsQ/DivIB [Aurantimonas sp. HBX-1]|uniref:cell division protein FtsQ/DivIB n=1 Tax=Aurantimonas sp. HBX-1 TaxID=2906072 RepID=UPI001F24C519|nr:cell division protein FtsQ/DivIB [Aurantimonas sp. HBX-1]UIJ73067.1 cell division protein FtsQ/DivIB [Aurantimonas sp. HBX-1]
MRAMSDDYRPLRAPGRLTLHVVRLARRASSGAAALAHAPLPRFGMLAAAVIGSSVVYGISAGGHTVTVIDAFAQPLGFSINRVDVEGNDETSEIDALQALWQTGSQSLFSLDPAAARETLEAMPWVDRASVAKVFPDHVRITLSEHRPYAVWQRGTEFLVVNREGREIVPYTPGRYAALPIVVGTGAASSAAALIDEMEVLPELRARVRAYIRVGDRRWDLRLENGVTIRLPENGAVEALAEVARMDREHGLLSRDIEAVDVRLSDRMVVKLTPEALVRRNAALEEREKIMKRSRKDNPV